ncbi:hypothetical protein GCM10023196_053120 [Actinoallomurus vinaceus]|uniref:RDD domain-containing protein n=1 Tax=Actinoallomurus vinaceus TaxID=1080074 RepID=A0ABP8UHG3_9ACTN
MHGPPAVPPPSFPTPFPPEPQPPEGAGAAPRVRRLTAWGIDTGLLWGAAVLLAMLTWARLHGYVVNDLPRKALSATGGLLLSGGDVEKAATDFGTGVWATFVGDVEQAFVLLIAIQVLYQFAGHAWLGRTLGKAAMDLRVRAAVGDAAKAGKARAFRRALVTTTGGTGLYCLAWILLLESQFVLALATWMFSVGVFAANSLPALFGGRRRTLADLLAGTAVVRARTYERAVAAARQGADRAWGGAQTAGQVAWDGAQAAGQVARDGAQAAGQIAWDGAQAASQVAWDGAQAAGQVARDAAREQAARIAQSDHVRRVVESERAQRVQGMGRRLGGRIKDAYRERATGRSPQEASPLPDASPAPARQEAPPPPDPIAPARQEAPQPPDPGPTPALPPPRPRFDPLQGSYGQETPYVPPRRTPPEQEHRPDRHEPPMTP